MNDNLLPPTTTPASGGTEQEQRIKDLAAMEQAARRLAAIQTVIETTRLPRRSDAMRARLLFGIRRVLVQRRRRRRVTGAVFAAALIVALSSGAVRHTWWHGLPSPQLAWSKVDMPGVGQLRLSEGARFSLGAAAAPAVSLESGELCAHIEHRDAMAGVFEVLTPQLRVRDVGTTFCVSVQPQVSTVNVTEGKVWTERKEGGAGLELIAGNAIRSDDSAFRSLPDLGPSGAPVRLEARRAPVLRECGDLSAQEDRRACYLKLSKGTGFGAQNALFSLALLDADQVGDHDLALHELHLYQARYPQGHLGPEVSLALMRILSSDGLNAQLVDETSYFTSAYPEHPKLNEVTLLRADSLFRLGRRAEAHKSYQTLLNGNVPSPIESAARRGASATAMPLTRDAKERSPQ